MEGSSQSNEKRENCGKHARHVRRAENPRNPGDAGSAANPGSLENAGSLENLENAANPGSTGSAASVGNAGNPSSADASFSSAALSSDLPPSDAAPSACLRRFAASSSDSRASSDAHESKGYKVGAAPSSDLRPLPDLTRTEELIRVRKKRKVRSGGKRAFLTVCVGLAIAVGLSAAALAFYVGSLSNAVSFSDEGEETRLREALDAVEPTEKEKPFYMLLLGSDAREGDTTSRSDVMILLRVDPENSQITMVSIPRDTMVDLPGYGRSKINAAYAYDGAAGAVEAVRKFAGVPIAHYAEIHFEELENLVDALGGVWVDVPVSNDETGASKSGLHISAGEQLLDGKTALAFARERYGYTRGDFQRADNQKILLRALIEQVLDVPPLELPGTIQNLAECVSTDLGLTDIISLAQKFQGAQSLTFYSATVPSSTMTLDNVSYVVTDQSAWAEMMQRVDLGADPNAQTVAESPAADAAGDASSADGAGDEGAAQSESGSGAVGVSADG